jgi:hypothetical protein
MLGPKMMAAVLLVLVLASAAAFGAARIARAPGLYLNGKRLPGTARANVSWMAVDREGRAHVIFDDYTTNYYGSQTSPGSSINFQPVANSGDVTGDKAVAITKAGNVLVALDDGCLETNHPVRHAIWVRELRPDEPFAGLTDSDRAIQLPGNPCVGILSVAEHKGEAVVVVSTEKGTRWAHGVPGHKFSKLRKLSGPRFAGFDALASDPKTGRLVDIRYSSAPGTGGLYATTLKSFSSGWSKARKIMDIAVADHANGPTVVAYGGRIDVGAATSLPSGAGPAGNYYLRFAHGRWSRPQLLARYRGTNDYVTVARRGPSSTVFAIYHSDNQPGFRLLSRRSVGRRWSRPRLLARQALPFGAGVTPSGRLVYLTD